MEYDDEEDGLIENIYKKLWNIGFYGWAIKIVFI